MLPQAWLLEEDIKRRPITPLNLSYIKDENHPDYLILLSISLFLSLSLSLNRTFKTP